MALTNLNVVWSNVERYHQALQEFSDPSEVGTSDAPGAVHQQHYVCGCLAVTFDRFPGRCTLITGDSLTNFIHSEGTEYDPETLY